MGSDDFSKCPGAGSTGPFYRCDSMSQLPGYPAHPQRFEVRPGLSMNYLDEGPRDGEVVVRVHGNPSWSYD